MTYCFWCDKPSGNCVELEQDPQQKVYQDYGLCPACLEKLGNGVIFAEGVTHRPHDNRPPISHNGDDEAIYPTGKAWMVTVESIVDAASKAVANNNFNDFVFLMTAAQEHRMVISPETAVRLGLREEGEV